MRGWQRRYLGGAWWILRTDALAELEGALLARGDDLGAELPVPHPRRGRSFHVLPSAGGGLFVKRFRASRYDAGLLYRILARRMRGAREFTAARRALLRGARIPEPLAFGVRHRLLRSYESRLVYRRLPECTRTLEALALAERSEPLRLRIAGRVGEIAGDLHASGVYHMDFTPSNAVLVGDPEGAFQLLAVDLETLALARPGRERLAARSRERTLESFGWRAGVEREGFLAGYRLGRARAA